MGKAIHALYEDSTLSMSEREREHAKELHLGGSVEEAFDAIEKFGETLEEERKREFSTLLKNYDGVQSEWEETVRRQCFAKGFSLGMRLAIEATEQ